MPLNDPIAPQVAARKPRLRVLANGEDVAGVLSAEVTQTSGYQAARWRVEIAANAAEGRGLGWWSDQDSLRIDVRMGFIGPDGGEIGFEASLVAGEIDHMDADMAVGTLNLEGRDLTAKFIDAKTQAAFKNQTFSEIVTKLAGDHGLQADVTPTKTPVGRYYELDHDRISLDQFSRTTTEWDLLTALARDEGFDLWMDGDTLNAHPAVTDTADPFVVLWEPADALNPVPRCNVQDLRLDRSLTLARDVVVLVRSWHSRRGAGFTRSAGPTRLVAQGKAQQYVFVRPNLTEQQAQTLANQLREQITRHERRATFCMPGELSLSPRSVVRIEGTDTSWDQTYFVDTITRRISWRDGFRQDVTLKNHSPQTETLA